MCSAGENFSDRRPNLLPFKGAGVPITPASPEDPGADIVQQKPQAGSQDRKVKKIPGAIEDTNKTKSVPANTPHGHMQPNAGSATQGPARTNSGTNPTVLAQAHPETGPGPKGPAELPTSVAAFRFRCSDEFHRIVSCHRSDSLNNC